MIHYWVVIERVIDLVKICMKKKPVDMMTKTIPIGEVQSISELHQCSPKIRWRMNSLEETV